MSRIICVFVSCQGDVEAEVQRLERVSDRFNRMDGDDHQVRIELWRWKDNAAHLIGPGPQEQIDRVLPDYDIYFGIMWAHCGKGTIDEYYAAHDRWQRTGLPEMLFFFNQQPSPSNEPEALRDHAAVREFRKSLVGLKNDYDGVDEFEDRAYDQIRLCVRRILKPNRDSCVEAKAVFPDSYRRWLRSECGNIELLGLELRQGQARRLSSVYVPLTTREHNALRDPARRPTGLRT